MASPQNWLFGNPLDPNQPQEQPAAPFLTPQGVNPGTLGPRQQGPTPIELGPKPEVPVPAEATAQVAAPPAITNELAQKVASGEESPILNYRDWLETNKTKSEAEWTREKWRKAGKLGKMSMILEAAAGGLSSFNQTYIPLTRGTAPPKPFESATSRQYKQYSQQNEEAIKNQMLMLGFNQKDIEQRLQAGRDLMSAQDKTASNQIEASKANINVSKFDWQKYMDTKQFDAAWQKAQASVAQYNEEQQLNWAKWAAGQDDLSLEQMLTRNLAHKPENKNKPAALAADILAHMNMIREAEAKARAIGRPRARDIQYPSGTHSTGVLNEWGVNQEGNLEEIKGKAYYPTPKGQALGAGYSAITSTGKPFNPGEYTLLNKDDAKKLSHFVETTRQADIALKGAASAARRGAPMFGLKGSSLVTSVRRMADEYGLEWVAGNTPSEEALILIGLKNAAMMHGRGQIGYRPAMNLVDALEKEIAGGKTASATTKLKSMAMFKLLTEYSGAQLVKPFEISQEEFIKTVQRVEMWVDQVVDGKGDIPSLGNLEELLGGEYSSGINWGSGTYNPRKFDKQQPVIGAQE